MRAGANDMLANACTNGKLSRKRNLFSSCKATDLCALIMSIAEAFTSGRP